MKCEHKMVNPATRRCVHCLEVLSKREHMHLYGPWSHPVIIEKQKLWIIYEQRRQCSVGSGACGEWLTKTKRIARDNELSREHVYEVDPGMGA